MLLVPGVLMVAVLTWSPGHGHNMQKVGKPSGTVLAGTSGDEFL